MAKLPHFLLKIGNLTIVILLKGNKKTSHNISVGANGATVLMNDSDAIETVRFPSNTIVGRDRHLV